MADPARKIRFYHPGKAFPSFSVTGAACELGCDYCRGHYLEGMTPVSDGPGLLERAKELSAAGGKGFLLSGGCDRRGRVPLGDFLATVQRIKQETPLMVNLHTGLLDGPDEARGLVGSGADCLSVDVVQDERVIREVMHLDRGKEDYRRTLELLFEAGARRVVPHVCLGIGSEEAEEKAVRLIARFPVGAVVVLALMPARGAPMGRAAPPSRERVLRAVRLAVGTVKAPTLLGCMRPRGDWRLEAECIEAGAEGVAMPSRNTVSWAEGRSYEVEMVEGCCALHR